MCLFIDYGRPQDTIPALGAARPAMVGIVLLAIALLFKRELWAESCTQLWCVSAFAAMLAVHVPFAVNNFYAYDATKTFILLLPVVFALPACVRSIRTLRASLGFCVLLMAYQAAYAILHGGHGTGAQFMDENDLALFLNTYLPFACYFLFTAESRALIKVVYALSVLVALAADAVSFSRGGLIGLSAMGAVVWLVSPRKVLSLVLVAVLAVGFVSFADDAVQWFSSVSGTSSARQDAGTSYWDRMLTSTDAESGTGKERVESWKSAWAMFLDNPLGVGGKNFQVRFEQYQTGYFTRGMWGRVAHSVWFTVLPELGIPGSLVYLVLLIANVRSCLRVRRTGRTLGGAGGSFLSAVGSALLASMVGFFASGTFLSVLYYPHYWYLTGFIVAADRIATTARETQCTELATST